MSTGVPGITSLPLNLTVPSSLLLGITQRCHRLGIAFVRQQQRVADADVDRRFTRQALYDGISTSMRAWRSFSAEAHLSVSIIEKEPEKRTAVRVHLLGAYKGGASRVWSLFPQRTVRFFFVGRPSRRTYLSHLPRGIRRPPRDSRLPKRPSWLVPRRGC